MIGIIEAHFIIDDFFLFTGEMKRDALQQNTTFDIIEKTSHHQFVQVSFLALNQCIHMEVTNRTENLYFAFFDI